MSVDIGLELNGVPLGRMDSQGLSARLYILPATFFSKAGISLPNHDESSILGRSLDLRGTKVLDEGMAQTGRFQCQFTTDYGTVLSQVTSDLSCEVPSTLSTIDLKCEEVSVFLIVEGYVGQAPIQNRFHFCPTPPKVIFSHPRLLLYQGSSYNATIYLHFNQRMTSSTKDEYVCLLSYFHNVN
jgi:hypothetical protein